MKKLVCILFLALLTCLAAAADVTGKWSGSFIEEGGDQGTAYLILTQTGNTITGTGGPDSDTQWPIQSGKIDGNKIVIQVADPNGAVYKCTLLVDGNSMKGDVEFTAEGQTHMGKVDVKKIN